MFCISILVRLDPNYAYVTVKVNIKFEVFGNVEVKVGKVEVIVFILLM